MNEYRISKAGLNLHTIAQSGQCFRMNEYLREDGSRYFDIVSQDKFIRVDEHDQVYTFRCEEDDVGFWVNYFDLNASYIPFNDAITHSEDKFLISALDYGRGMRILRQDYWEALISFIISQNNNISKIKKCVEAICHRFGRSFLYSGEIFYSFPTLADMKDITLDDLQGLGLGYRDKYIWNVCHCSLDDILPDRDILLKLNGVGPKVASCVLLYGHHKMDEFPIDTWMKKIIDDIYGGHFDSTPYYDFRGYIQQLMFYYYRSLKSRKGS